MKVIFSKKKLILLIVLILMSCVQTYITKPSDEVKSYAVTFEKNDDDASGIMGDMLIKSGSTEKLSSCLFTKAGWTFIGWSTTPTGNVEYTNQASYTMGSKNVTLYAKWSANGYVVTFNKNDSDATGTMSTQTIASGSSLTLTLNSFNKTGWTFIGWSTTPTGNVEYTNQASYTMGSKNVTLYAKWSANGYVVTFNKNDSDATGTMSTQTIASGSSLTLTSNSFNKTGWAFIGWSTTPTGNVEYTNQASYTMGSKNVTLYAKWSANGYVVTFNKNDSDATGTMSTQTIASGSSLTLTSNSFNKTGWTFIGWSTTPTGNVEYTNQASYTMGSKNVTLYAKWSANGYVVTFNKNDSDATGTMSTQTIASGSSLTLTSNSFNKTGWAFIGWSTTPTGNVEYTNQASYTMGSKNVTLYAKWSANEYVVTFNKNDLDATGTMSTQTIASGSSLTLTSNSFNKTGWTFIGWSTTPTGNVEYTNQASYTMGSKNVTLYAKWSAEQYTVSFSASGGSTPTPSSKIIAFDSSYGSLPTTSRIGYTFTGWWTGYQGTGIHVDSSTIMSTSSDHYLYASWSPNQYTVSFNSQGGNSSTSSKIVTFTSTYGTLPIPTKNGYSFAGWWTDAAGAGTKITSDTICYTYSDHTLYAKWSSIGPLDFSFGKNGIATTNVINSSCYSNDIEIQSDGKILIAGYAIYNNGNFAIARFDVNGVIDTTFGTDGGVSTDIGGYTSEKIKAISIQSDGKIIAGGIVDLHPGNGDENFVIARYNTNGSLDTNFGTDGFAITSFGTDRDGIEDVAIQTDGKIIAVGFAEVLSKKRIALSRYNSNGTIDTSFGTDGKIVGDYGQASKVAIQTDGKIVVIGTSNSNIFLARYGSNGTIDTNFGTNGKVTTSVGSGGSYAKSIEILSNTKILVAGISTNTNEDFTLLRYNNDGSLDTSFGTNGITITDISVETNRAYAVEVDSNSNIVVGGYSFNTTSQGSYAEFAIARYTSNGILQADAIISTDLGIGNDYCSSMLIQPDGKIVLGGDSNGSIALARYIAYPQ